MRVDGFLSFPESSQPGKVARSGSQAQQNPAVSVDSTSSQDQASLSVDSTTIQQLKSSLSQLPDVRQDRVEALSQAVSGGNYQISDRQLGSAIASDMLGKVIA
jgi:flagellar biosynthesis anti-sigma factor FlgM